MVWTRNSKELHPLNPVEEFVGSVHVNRVRWMRVYVGENRVLHWPQSCDAANVPGIVLKASGHSEPRRKPGSVRKRQGTRLRLRILPRTKGGGGSLVPSSQKHYLTSFPTAVGHHLVFDKEDFHQQFIWWRLLCTPRSSRSRSREPLKICRDDEAGMLSGKGRNHAPFGSRYSRFSAPSTEPPHAEARPPSGCSQQNHGRTESFRGRHASRSDPNFGFMILPCHDSVRPSFREGGECRRFNVSALPAGLSIEAAVKTPSVRPKSVAERTRHGYF